MAQAAAEQAVFQKQSANTAFHRFAGFIGTLARKKPLGFISLVILLFMFVLAAVPSLFATHDPADTSAGARLQNYCLGPKDTFLCPTTVEDSVISGKRVVEGSITEPFGTDQLQRDVYSRAIYGARWAIYIGLISVAISSALSLAIGVSCGYFGGKYDAAVQRFVDAIMALPALVVLLALPQMIGKWDIDGPLPLDHARITFFKLAPVLGILGGAGGSRVIRSAVIGVRSAQYLEAARVIGCRDVHHAAPRGAEHLRPAHGPGHDWPGRRDPGGSGPQLPRLRRRRSQQANLGANAEPGTGAGVGARPGRHLARTLHRARRLQLQYARRRPA